MDRDSELLVAHLRSRPPRDFIPWVSPQFAPGRRWSTHCVDVRTVDADAPGRRWAWTIGGPDDIEGCDPEEVWCFEWPHDIDVYEIWKMPAPPHNAAPRFILELPLRRDEDADPGGSPAPPGILIRAGWTSDAISAALKAWAHRYAGRGDLHFFWDDIDQFSTEFDAAGSPHPRRSVRLGPGREFVVADDADGPLLRYLGDALEQGLEPRDILYRILREL